MKRDMGLVRSVLLQVEAAEEPLELGMISHVGHSDAELAYHIELMRERGLIDADIERAWGGTVVGCTVAALTWDGQDFLDAIRSERVWAKACDLVRKSVGTTTFEVFKTVACKVAVDMACSAMQ